jgi:hypothetical protein
MKIAERGGMNGIRTLAKIMATMDSSELKWGMRDYGVTLSDRELDIVLAAFDRNKDGKIDFDEFLRGIRVRSRSVLPMSCVCWNLAECCGCLCPGKLECAPSSVDSHGV